MVVCRLKGVGIAADAAAQGKLLAGRRMDQVERAFVRIKLATSWTYKSWSNELDYSHYNPGVVRHKPNEALLLAIRRFAMLMATDSPKPCVLHFCCYFDLSQCHVLAIQAMVSHKSHGTVRRNRRVRQKRVPCVQNARWIDSIEFGWLSQAGVMIGINHGWWSMAMNDKQLLSFTRHASSSNEAELTLLKMLIKTEFVQSVSSLPSQLWAEKVIILLVILIGLSELVSFIGI